MHVARRWFFSILAFSITSLLWNPTPCASAQANSATDVLVQPTLLVDIDHRTALDLDGDWHYIVDPYQTGLYNFHQELKKNGFFEDLEAPATPNGLVEYDFAKSPTLKVPGDWNT